MNPKVLKELRRHGLEPAPGETPTQLREKLNDSYLEAVRRLKARQQSGEIALRDYAGQVETLRERFPLLGLPLSYWDDES